jgi:asparagine synthase (glutamine-hydrolysing)
VAAYLSGGLDSSITTAFIKEISPANLQTFSIGFSDKDFDETVYQQEVSKYFDTRHTNFYCTPADIAEVFPKVVWYSELPIIRTAPAPMFLLSEKVRQQNIKVVITGEGADEIMAGYDIFKEAQIRHFWARDPNSRLRPLLLQKLYPYIPQIQKMNAGRLKFVFGYKLDDVGNPFYAHLLRWNNGAIMCRYFNTEIRDQLIGYNPVQELEQMLPADFNRWDGLSQAQWVESKLLMSNYLLSSQGDRMGMGNSIEGRYPFLDYRLIEYSAQLPPEFKMKGLTEKYLLKKMMQGKLPESIVKRSKQAYRAPILSAFLSADKPDYVKELLSESGIRTVGIFDPTVVHNLLAKFNSTMYSESDTMALTAILSTQLIHSMFVSNHYKPEKYETLLEPKIVRK